MFPLPLFSLDFLPRLGETPKKQELNMLKKILMNDITDSLGRRPTTDEFKIFVDYINDYLIDQEQSGKKVFLVDVEFAIKECRDAEFKQCEECGEYYLANSDEWNVERGCCRNCHDYEDPDMMPGGHDY